jgi:hypothetical protein
LEEKKVEPPPHFGSMKNSIERDRGQASIESKYTSSYYHTGASNTNANSITKFKIQKTGKMA